MFSLSILQNTHHREFIFDRMTGLHMFETPHDFGSVGQRSGRRLVI